MAEPEKAAVQLKSGCFCGKSKVEIDGPLLFSSFCHCTICQRLTGAPYGHFLGFPSSAVKIVEGENELRPLKSSDQMTRYFCGACNGTVYSQSHIPDYDFRDILAGTLDRDDNGISLYKDLEAIQPKMHIHYEMRVRDVDDGLPKFDQFPSFD